MSTLYILQLEHGKYYVGKTDDVDARYSQHQRGGGSEWTRLHKPVKLLEQRPVTSSHDETNVTKDLMKKYGLDNVRGGAYCQVDLPDYVEDAIQHEFRSTEDRCYKCGKPGHFGNQCKRKSSFSGTCGCGESFLDCEEFMTHMRSCKIRNASHTCEYCKRMYETERETISCQCKFAKIARMAGRSKLVQKTSNTKSTGACYRCGRAGHWSPDCYARTDVRGNSLDSDE